MWSNALRLINVILAALVAMNYFEPLARKLEEWQPSYAYCWDFLALWALFGVAVVVFRAATDALSRVKVRFLKIADQIGSGVFAAAIGWVLVAFTLTTLHTAPLGEHFFFGAFQGGEPMFLGTAPDLQFLYFAQNQSVGALCNSVDGGFSPKNDFVINYAERRRGLESQMTKFGTPRLTESQQAVIPGRQAAAPPKKKPGFRTGVILVLWEVLVSFSAARRPGGRGSPPAGFPSIAECRTSSSDFPAPAAFGVVDHEVVLGENPPSTELHKAPTDWFFGKVQELEVRGRSEEHRLAPLERPEEEMLRQRGRVQRGQGEGDQHPANGGGKDAAADLVGDLQEADFHPRERVRGGAEDDDGDPKQRPQCQKIPAVGVARLPLFEFFRANGSK